MNNCINTNEVQHVHSFHAHSGLVDFHVTCLDDCLRQTWPSWHYSLCLSPSDLTQLTLQSMSVSIRPDPAGPTVYNYVSIRPDPADPTVYVCLHQTWPSWPYSLCLSPSDLTQLTLQSIIMSVSIRPDPADPTVYNYVCLHQTWPSWPYSL